MIQPRHVTHRSDHLVDKNKRKDLLRAIHTFKSMSETVSAGIFVVDEAEAEAEACANPEGLSKGPRASQEMCAIRVTGCLHPVTRPCMVSAENHTKQPANPTMTSRI